MNLDSNWSSDLGYNPCSSICRAQLLHNSLHALTCTHYSTANMMRSSDKTLTKVSKTIESVNKYWGLSLFTSTTLDRVSVALTRKVLQLYQNFTEENLKFSAHGCSKIIQLSPKNTVIGMVCSSICDTKLNIQLIFDRRRKKGGFIYAWGCLNCTSISWLACVKLLVCSGLFDHNDLYESFG